MILNVLWPVMPSDWFSVWTHSSMSMSEYHWRRCPLKIPAWTFTFVNRLMTVVFYRDDPNRCPGMISLTEAGPAALGRLAVSP